MYIYTNQLSIFIYYKNMEFKYKAFNNNLNIMITYKLYILTRSKYSIILQHSELNIHSNGDLTE